jgi:pimeloyl-ACP methyl ester carboxylesterase
MNEIILLHGALGAAVQFEKVEKLLYGKFKVYTFDFSNHGKNVEDDKDLNINLFTDDLKNFIEKNQLENPNIFGYSMGGYVALNYALNNPLYSGSIFTLATKFAWNPEVSNKEVLNLNPNLIKSKVPKFAEELFSLHGDKWENLLSKTAKMMLDLGNEQAFAITDLSKLNNKVRVSVGDKDKFVSLEENYEIFKTIPNSSFTVLPDTIHPLQKVNIDRLVYEITSFFS